MRKHVILTNGRSGSNHLVQVLNQHPRVTNYGEVLGEYTLPRRLHDVFGYGGRTPEDYLDHMLSSRSNFYLAHAYDAVRRVASWRSPRPKRWSNVETLGVKELAIRLSRAGLSTFLAERDEIAVIHLERRNCLRRLISVMAVESDGAVAVTSARGSETRRRLNIDVQLVRDRLPVIERERVDEEEMADTLPPERVLRLVYEEMFASSVSLQRGYRAMFEFLAVDPIDVQGTHRKVLSPELSDTVVNYPELAAALRRGPWGHYLDEP